MTIRLWDPMRDALTLREAMERMLDDAVLRPWGGVRGQQAMSVPLDIREMPDMIVVKAPVPGFAAGQIDISVQGDVLTLTGKREDEKETKEGTSYLREWHMGSFQRVVQLPAAVDSDKAKASYKSGVLTIELPKVTEQITRKISVQRE
jgi:HSP20 family protein